VVGLGWVGLEGGWELFLGSWPTIVGFFWGAEGRLRLLCCSNMTAKAKAKALGVSLCLSLGWWGWWFMGGGHG